MVVIKYLTSIHHLGLEYQWRYWRNDTAIQEAPDTGAKRTIDYFYLSVDSPIADRTVTLEHPGEVSKPERRFSKFRCSGDENNVDGFVERLCLFENVCFDKGTRSFHFYQRPGANVRPVLFDSRLGELTNFTHGDHGFVAIKQLFYAATDSEHDTFAPRMVLGESPVLSSPSTTLRLSTLHVLWSTWAPDDNLGHVLWEEMAGIWFAMLRMNVLSTNAIAMHWPENLPERALAKKFRDAFFPAISSQPPVSFYPYVEGIAGDGSGNTTVHHICFDQFLVGGNVRRFLHRMSWHNYGHEPLFFSLRARILESLDLDPYSIPTAHRIVITRKTSSNYHWDPRYKTHRSIYNVDEVVEFVKSKYQQIRVDAVDFKDYSMMDQIQLLLSTTILITPAGGISMILPFLPDGAHAIILDYLEKEDNTLIGTKAGESVSMEAPFWNFWPHVKKLYYQVRSREEMRPDDPSRTLDDVSWRDETSIQVNLSRLESFLEMAFENMSP